MSKSILISIKPKWVAKILNGDKTIEIRKSFPKCDLHIDVYIYCTKDNYELVKPKDYGKYLLFTKDAVKNAKENSFNGKVVAKFTLNKWETITYDSTYKLFKLNDVLQKSCLTEYELFDYLKGKVGYAWHISNLEIFDRPRELSEFKHWIFYKECSKCPYGKSDNDYGLCSQCCEIKPVIKAPQSWQFIEVEE